MQEMQKMWVQSLGWEDPLEEEMGTHSSILAWKIPWTGEPGGLQSIALQRVRHNWAHSTPNIINSEHWRMCFDSGKNYIIEYSKFKYSRKLTKILYAIQVNMT